MQLDSHTQTTDRRMEKINDLLQTFIGSPQLIASTSIGFIYLVDATHKKHPVPMNMASSFEVRLYVSPEIILTIIFSNSMTLFEHYFNQAVLKARYYDDI